jgi:uncharacterized protein (TIGR00255 family)
MVLSSMTGFGYSLYQGRFASIKVEARAVNHRFAEFNVRLSREWSRLEEEIRSLVSQKILRGRVDLFLTIERTSPAPKRVVVDWSLLDSLHGLELEVMERYPNRAESKGHMFEWLTYPEVVQIQEVDTDIEEILDDVRAAVTQALDSLCEMRVREGTRLQADMESKLALLTKSLETIAARVPQATAQYQEKLRQRMRELANDVDESKLLSEIAALLEKQTIDEELVRLHSHIEAFRETLHGGSPAGRRLDFIVQEMHREINTIGSKSSDLTISTCVVDAKVLIEQLREQTQNIE